MTMDARIFYVILTINTIAAISYEVWNETHWRENPGARTGGRIRTVVMLLTPIVGPVFFLMGTLVQLILFRQEVDLEDVIFSKERVQTRQMQRETLFLLRRLWRYPIKTVCGPCS